MVILRRSEAEPKDLLFRMAEKQILSVAANSKPLPQDDP